MSTRLPSELVDYLAARDRERNQQIDDTLNTLTPREQALVREAAVMGYVQGTYVPRDDPIPPDTTVLRHVIAACLTMPHLYPTLAQGDR